MFQVAFTETNPAAPKAADEDLRIRVARLEGQFASSWAAYAREDYENRFRADCKHDLLRFATTVMVSAVLVMGGGAYLLINAAVTNSLRSENAATVAAFERRFAELIEQTSIAREWQQLHDAGVQNRYLVSFYGAAQIPQTERQSLQEKAIRNARDFFDKARKKDPSKATTYWELGNAFYGLPHAAQLDGIIELHTALTHYDDAIDLYTDTDVAKGWRGEARIDAATVCVRLAEQASSKQKRNEHMQAAIRYLDAIAEHDIRKTNGDIRNRLQQKAEATRKLLDNPSWGGQSWPQPAF